MREAIEEGAVLRMRPKAMTVAVIFAGLLPIMLSGGTGAEVMQRIAAPMVGGMVTAPLLVAAGDSGRVDADDALSAGTARRNLETERFGGAAAQS